MARGMLVRGSVYLVESTLQPMTWLSHIESHSPDVVSLLEWLGAIFPIRREGSGRPSGVCLLLAVKVGWVLFLRTFTFASLCALWLYVAVGLVFDNLAGHSANYQQAFQFFCVMSALQLTSAVLLVLYICRRLISTTFRPENTAHLHGGIGLVKRFLIGSLLVVGLEFICTSQQQGSQPKSVSILNLWSALSIPLSFFLATSLLFLYADVKAALELVQACCDLAQDGSLTLEVYSDAHASVKARVKEENFVHAFILLVAAANSIAIIISVFLVSDVWSSPASGGTLVLGILGTFGRELMLLAIALVEIVRVNDASERLTMLLGESALSTAGDGQRIFHQQLVHPIAYKVLGWAITKRDLRYQVLGFVAFLVVALIKQSYDIEFG